MNTSHVKTKVLPTILAISIASFLVSMCFTTSVFAQEPNEEIQIEDLFDPSAGYEAESTAVNNPPIADDVIVDTNDQNPAVSQSSTPNNTNTNPSPSSAGQLQFNTLKNPLGEGGIRTFTGFIESVLKIVVTIGVPIVVLAIIWSGFLYVKAQGKPEAIGQAHKALMWTIVGAVLLIGAWTIANAIQETVTKIGTGETTLTE